MFASAVPLTFNETELTKPPKKLFALTSLKLASTPLKSLCNINGPVIVSPDLLTLLFERSTVIVLKLFEISINNFSTLVSPFIPGKINKLFALTSLKLASFALISPLLEASIYKFVPIIFARNVPNVSIDTVPRESPELFVKPIVNSFGFSRHPIKAFSLGSVVPPLFIIKPISNVFVVSPIPVFNDIKLSEISKFVEFINVVEPVCSKTP